MTACRKVASIAAFSAVIAFVLFSVVTQRTDVTFVDGPPLSYYGFPFAHVRASQGASLHYLVNPGYLALDFLLYYFAIAAVVSRKRIYDVLVRRKRIVLSLLLSLSIIPVWAIAVSSFYFTNNDIYRDTMDGQRGQVVAKKLHVGYDRPYHPPDYHQ